MKTKKTPLDMVLSSEEILDFLKTHHFDEFCQNLDNEWFFSSQNLIEFLINSESQTNKASFNVENVKKISKNEFVLTRSYDQFGSSNGYLDFVLEKLKNKKNFKNQKIVQKKNKNHIEVILEFIDEPELTFAMVYGFKNIQNVVNQIKTNRCKYSYCEIMACPGGCLNGGGQPKYESTEARENALSAVTLQNNAKLILYNTKIVEHFCDLLEKDEFGKVLPLDFVKYIYESIKPTDGLRANW